MATFNSFVILAEMRTGSNFLESNLNAIEGVHSHGELFNPHFIGAPHLDQVLGFTKQARDDDPIAVLDLLKTQDDLSGFRLFHDHDERVFDAVISDPKCAKIILTRNPLESYVSLKIVRKTDQWKLTHVKNKKAAQAVFDPIEFRAHVERIKLHQLKVLKLLQHSGQTVFYIDYEDLQDVDTLNGLLQFLGVAGRADKLDKTLKKQNPEPITEKVKNPEEMEIALQSMDFFDLNRTPNFEPRRMAAVPTYHTTKASNLLFAPIAGAANGDILDWLRAVENGLDPQSGHTQKTLRAWKSERPGYRSFTMVTHPLERAHNVFCEKILSGEFGKIKQDLSKGYGADFSKTETLEGHVAAFSQFLAFLKRNLNGQTAIRVDPHWASQLHIVQGLSTYSPIDVIIRRENMTRDLQYLVDAVAGDFPTPKVAQQNSPFRLEDIYSPQLEEAARAAYLKDYISFGYSNWEGAG